MNIFDKDLLDINEKMIKNAKRSMKIAIVMIILCSMFVISYIYLCILQTSIFNFIISIIWCGNLYLNYKLLNKSKENIKIFTKSYYDILKNIDYPKYLRSQRFEKLKKLNKKRLFQ